MTTGSWHRPFAGLQKVNLDGIRFRLIDAEDQVVGRLCSHLAQILQGKDKPTYAPHLDNGDICVVINTAKVCFTGKKWEQKIYYSHSGYPGGLKKTTALELWNKDAGLIIKEAVYGMLPKNKLRGPRMLKLRVFPAAEHPFGEFDLVPWKMPERRLRDRGLGWLLPEGMEPMNPEAYERRMRGSRTKGAAPIVNFQHLLAPEERAALVTAGSKVPLIDELEKEQSS